MNKHLKYSYLFSLMIGMLLFSIVAISQTQQLPEIKFPAIPDYTPKTKKGWVGQYIYEFHFLDSLYYRKGNYEKGLWLRADNTYTGYIEFPTEVRGAIRTNQPDKNNTARYEGWIRSGTSYSWSVVNDTIKRTAPLGGMGSINITGKVQTTQVFSSNGAWIKGWMDNADMQMDHTEKKYSLAVPVISFNVDGNEWGGEIYFNPAKRVPVSRNENGTKNYISIVPVKAQGWDFTEGEFADNQKEIVIRKRIPVEMGMEIDLGSSTKLLVKKGYIDFYLVLRKDSFDGTASASQAASISEMPAVAEKEPVQQKSTDMGTQQQGKIKKAGLGGLKRKLGGIIKNI